MSTVIRDCTTYCKEMKRNVDLMTTTSPKNALDRTLNSSSSIDKKLNSSMFKDEVPYFKFLLEYAMPFLEDFTNTVESFSVESSKDILTATRKSLFNWKNNPENNEKYLRKEFKKPTLSNDLIEDNRSLLGVQQPPEWLENLNIGSIMHMKPLKYKDYAQRRELVTEITKDALQEKAIYQSLIYFTTATEMRFQEMSNIENENVLVRKKSKEEIRGELFRNSEAFHLKAIELVCRYLTGPCPYVNHLISSYQKHYNQDLETIPEESFISASEQVSIADIPSKKKAPPLPLSSILNQPNKIEHFLKPIVEAQKGQKESKHSQEFSEEIEKPKEKEKEKKRVQENEKLKEKEKEKEKEKQQPTHSTSQSLRFPEGHRILERKPTLPDKPKPEEIRSIVSPNSARESRDLHKNSDINLVTLGNILPKHATNSTNSGSKKPKPPANEEQAVSPRKTQAKKMFNIPNLNLNKVVGSNEKPPSQTERNVFTANTGFRSERNNYKDPDMSGGDSTDRSNKEKVEGSGGINFFFYKNFNKFIQNLYIQDELLLKKKYANEKKDQDKFAATNTSYKKDAESTYAKKPTHNTHLSSSSGKKPSTAIPTSTNSSQSARGITTTLLQNNSAKKFIIIDEEKKYYYKPKEELYNNYVKSSGSKSSKSFNKSASKSGLNLDLSKTKYDQTDTKSFFTPREFTKY